MLLNHPRHISSDCYTCAYRDTTVKTSTLELFKLYKSTYEHAKVSQFMLHSHNVNTEGLLEGTKSSGGGGGGGV